MKPFYNFLENAKVQFDFALFSFAMQKLRRPAAFLLGSETCAVCKKQNVFLCNSCFCKTFALAKNVRRCKKCGRILNNGKNYCVDCAGGNIFSALDFALPVFAYTGNRKKLLQLWKMEQNRQLVFYFARFFYKYYAKYFNSIVLVVKMGPICIKSPKIPIIIAIKSIGAKIKKIAITETVKI